MTVRLLLETSAQRRRGLSFSGTVVVALLMMTSVIIGMTLSMQISAKLKDGFDLIAPVLQPSAPQKKIPLTELTNSAANVECPIPLVPLYDRIVDPSSFGSQKIPRLIHVSWKSRCLSPDMVDMAQRWKDQFPSYSFFFHGDEAVDRLLQQDWPEFPQLAKIMNTCVKFGGAIKIDIWRVLVLYKYGGIYSDLDSGPGVKLTEDAIQSNDSAFFLSDAWNRPSQWLHAMEPKHPIAYFTMLEILTRVLALEDISIIKPVFLTGPDALKHGYGKALNWGNTTDDIFSSGVHVGKFSKLARKISFHKGDNVLSDWAVGVDKKKFLIELNTTHWRTMIQERAEIPTGPCWDQLYKTDLKNSYETA
jgi:hypothetical protein